MNISPISLTPSYCLKITADTIPILKIVICQLLTQNLNSNYLIFAQCIHINI